MTNWDCHHYHLRIDHFQICLVEIFRNVTNLMQREKSDILSQNHNVTNLTTDLSQNVPFATNQFCDTTQQDKSDLSRSDKSQQDKSEHGKSEDVHNDNVSLS